MLNSCERDRGDVGREEARSAAEHGAPRSTARTKRLTTARLYPPSQRTKVRTVPRRAFQATQSVAPYQRRSKARRRRRARRWRICMRLRRRARTKVRAASRPLRSTPTSGRRRRGVAGHTLKTPTSNDGHRHTDDAAAPLRVHGVRNPAPLHVCAFSYTLRRRHLLVDAASHTQTAQGHTERPWAQLDGCDIRPLKHARILYHISFFLILHFCSSSCSLSLLYFTFFCLLIFPLCVS